MWPAGGATLDYVRSLAASDINMDLATFTSLDENVVLVGLFSTGIKKLKCVCFTYL